MDSDAAARQGRAVSLALAALGDSASAVTLLNTYDPTLDSRPIDLAVASAAGLLAVERFIASRQVLPATGG